MPHLFRWPASLAGIAGYGFALAAFAIALAGRFALAPWLPPTGFPFLTFFPAVMLATLFGGLGPGLLASVLSTAAAKYFFIPATGSFAFGSHADVIALAFFVGVLLVDVVAIHVMRTSLREIRAERARVAELSAARGRLAAELAESEARLRTIVDTVPVGLVMAELPSGRILGGNSYVETLLRHPVLHSPDINGYDEWVSYDAEGRRVPGHAYPLARMVLAGEENPSIEVHYQRGDGTRAWTRIMGRPVHDAQGKVTGGVVALVDVDGERRTQEVLAESEARLRSVVETAADGILVADAEGRIVSANPAAVRFFGHDAPASLLGSGLDLLMPGWEAAWHVPPGGEARTGVPARELAARHRDGRSFPVELSAAAFESGGRRFLTAIVREVSERKRAEELRLLLAQEVDHRAKNALAVALSLLRLTPRDDPALFAASVEGRVAAMARAHSLLATEEWRGADLRILAEGESAAHAGRVQLGGPAVQLTPEAVQPVAMLLHELATNAAKYGALTRAEGRVALGWTLAADGGLRLRWEERGGPPVQQPSGRRGFGSRLMSSLAGQQLGGGIAFDWTPGGLAAEITIAPRFVAAAHAAGGPVSAPRRSPRPAEPRLRRSA